jgi:hypothetical protein
MILALAKVVLDVRYHFTRGGTAEVGKCILVNDKKFPVISSKIEGLTKEVTNPLIQDLSSKMYNNLAVKNACFVPVVSSSLRSQKTCWTLH